MLDAGGADGHAARRPVDHGVNRMEIGKKTTRGYGRRVQTDAALILGETVTDDFVTS